MKLHAHKHFTGSFLIEDEKCFAVARMIDDYYNDEKLARLMASAPELLEALELAERIILHYGVNHTEAGKPHPQELACSQIAEAIAKAKGE